MGAKHPSLLQRPDSAPARAGSCHLPPGPGCIFLAGYLVVLFPSILRATLVCLSHSRAWGWAVSGSSCPGPLLRRVCVFIPCFGEAFSSSGPPTCWNGDKILK